MAEMCLMASHGYLPGSGAVFHQEKSPVRALEVFHNFLPHHGSIQELVKDLSFNLSLRRKDECRSAGGLLNSSHFTRVDSIPKRPALIDLQGTHPDSVSFSIGIAERCYMHEMIQKLLASGSIGERDSLVDLSMLYDLMEPKSAIADLPCAEQSASCSKWCCNDPPPLPHLIYPTKELFLQEPVFDLVGDGSTCPEKAHRLDLHPQYNYPSAEMNVIFDLYSSKSINTFSKRTLLVPYFERRRRPRGKAEASKLATENIGSSTKIGDQLKEKSSTKKKTNSRAAKARNISNSNSHACESLLSIIVDTNKQGRSTILSLKSSPQLPQILTQFSATIAGVGIAIVLSHLLRVASGRVPFSTSKLLSTGFGLGLVWFSWAVNKLRDTIITISKTSSKLVEKEEDEMMNHLDRNLKDVYFRAAALMVLAVMRMA